MPSKQRGPGAREAEDEDSGLYNIVNLFKPKSKAIAYGASSVTLSAQLRKMIAQFSFESSTIEGGKLMERGVKPTARVLRNAVWAANLKWPWSNESDLQVIRRARKDYLAGVFDGIAVELGQHPRTSPAMRVGRAGPRPKFELIEQQLGEWVDLQDRKQISRLAVIRHALELDPTFFDHHQANTPELLRTFMAKTNSWYYRGFKRRQKFSIVAIASVGRGLPDNAMEIWDRFSEECLAARRRDDGSLLPPSRVGAIDQVPITRITVGRTTLRRTGSQARKKVKTGGKEKERWTATPIFIGDGKMGSIWATATFHGAKPKPGKKVNSTTPPSPFAFTCNCPMPHAPCPRSWRRIPLQKKFRTGGGMDTHPTSCTRATRRHISSRPSASR